MVESRVERQNDFLWRGYAEPHAERKKLMIKKYGKEINALMGPEPLTKYLVLAATLLQLGLAFTLPLAISNSTFLPSLPRWAIFLFITYWVGGTANHNLFLAIHEVTHNVAFRAPILNDLLSIFANLPIGVPYSLMFKSYHAEHHRYQGWDGVDTDIPMAVEARLFHNTFGKFFFAFFQILFYAFRPCIIRPPKLNFMHGVNWGLYIIAWIGFYTAIGGGERFWYGLGYCLLSTFCAGALHPMSGHFISEHYVFDPKSEQETYSYYGPWNILGYNVGYHNEHHDFPNIAWSRLPALRALAPEFYEHLEQTDSWPMTVFRFIFDSRVNAFCRVKRERDSGVRSPLICTDHEGLAPASNPASPVMMDEINNKKYRKFN